jgi:hypothetical protein
MKKDSQMPAGKKIDGMYEGFPYVGPPLNLKSDDPPSMLPRRTHNISVQTFMMNDDKDVEKYEAAMHEVGAGWAQVSLEEIVWIPRHETWKIFLRLLHHKYIEPEDMTRAKTRA